jgi:nucleotide-binding universal stress UspA family protein
MLGVPEKAAEFKRALLAYDGSPLAKEALFVATYFAEMWKTELVVFTALDGPKLQADVQDYVRQYLDIHEVEAEYIISEHAAMNDLKNITDEHDVNLVLMGGYGVSTFRQVFDGSTLNYMLRESNVPIFICR